MFPKFILRQNLSTVENRLVAMTSMVEGIPCRVTSLEQLADIDCDPTTTLPVGSVEFVREFMRARGIREPENLSYPSALAGFLGREVTLSKVGDVKTQRFVKPTTTKRWTGFVYDPEKNADDYDEHDLEQWSAFATMQPDELVWSSEPVQWLSEWRFYVLDRTIMGQARYDAHGADDATVPDASVVRACVDALPFDHPCAVDMGVIEGGATALVEVNDAWAIGLYDQCLDHRTYTRLLWERWKKLHIE